MIVSVAYQKLSPYYLFRTLLIISISLAVGRHLFSHHVVTSYTAMAYSAEEFDLKHRSIEKFDIIESADITWSKLVSPREAHGYSRQNNHIQPATSDLNAILSDEHSHNPKRRMQFSSLGRKFKLTLSESTNLITQDFSVTVLDENNKPTKVPYNRGNLQILNGYVNDDLESRASVSFDKHDKLMIAQIKSGKETIIVEPTYLHQDSLWSGTSTNLSDNDAVANGKLYNDTMLVYSLEDHKQFQPNDDMKFRPEELCGYVNMSDYINKNPTVVKNDESKSDIDDVFKFYENKSRLHKRGIEYLSGPPRDKTRCTLHLVADYLFYIHIGKGDLQTTINYMLALVNRVNDIFLPTVWETGDELVEKFNNIGFTVQNITIHQEYTRLSSSDVHYNMLNDKVWAAREFLDNFSRNSPPRHYCLAHLLTYRKFDSPVLGLAYVASTRYGTIGGICSPTQQRGDIFYKHNTGISTSKGISGETLITRQADLVVAHELGHNLGAEHDAHECRPSPFEGGAYLMHPFAVMGFERNNKLLSNCSRLAIGRVIRRKAPTCFVSVMDHVCGNGIKEDDEECDGGELGHAQGDPCCDSSCRFTPGSQCSERHSLCCSQCRISPAGVQCSPAEEYNCKQTSYCDGRQAECPEPPPVEDNRVCKGRGLCDQGNCIPFCEARRLTSCLCNNPKDACKLCCKPINGTCTPYDNKEPYLPDGLLCYRGVCEKGRCEQPIQDVPERLWDILEDISIPAFFKFLRDNIIVIVILISIPIWCVITHYINEFDRRIKDDVIGAIMRSSARNRKEMRSHSPFLPRLFVGDEIGSANSADDVDPKEVDVHTPLKSRQTPIEITDETPANLNSDNNLPHRAPGFTPPSYGFQVMSAPGNDDSASIEPRGSIALNSIELPFQPRYQEDNDAIVSECEDDSIRVEDDSIVEANQHKSKQPGSYSTQV